MMEPIQPETARAPATVTREEAIQWMLNGSPCFAHVATAHG